MLWLFFYTNTWKLIRNYICFNFQIKTIAYPNKINFYPINMHIVVLSIATGLILLLVIIIILCYVSWNWIFSFYLHTVAFNKAGQTLKKLHQLVDWEFSWINNLFWWILIAFINNSADFSSDSNRRKWKSLTIWLLAMRIYQTMS